MACRALNWSSESSACFASSIWKKKGIRRRDSLSGGMRQLLAIGCALVHDPSVLFFDEPTRGLDPVHRQQIWNLLYDLSNEGKTIFVTTHYMDEAERCTEVGFIENGRLLAKASPRALKVELSQLDLLEIDVEPLMPALVRLRDLPELLGVSLRSGSLRLYAPEPEKLIATWRENWPFPGSSIVGRTLGRTRHGRCFHRVLARIRRRFETISIS